MLTSKGFSFYAFLDDLKSSLYAKIWLALGIISIILIIIIMAHFGALAHINDIEPSFRMWVEDRTKLGIKFPQFVVSSQDPTVHFVSFACSFYKNIVPLKDCPNKKDCKIIETDSILATIDRDNVTCILTLKFDNPKNLSNSAIKWDIIQHTFKESTLSTYVDPDVDAAILLKKETYFIHRTNELWVEWNPRTIYFNNVVVPNAMVVNIMMSSLLETHFQNYHFYSGWLAFADFGGVLFLIYTLHFFIMVLIGCVIKNDAVTIGGESYKREGGLLNQSNKNIGLIEE